uniref:F-box/WD-40 repeat-containing protein At3g52030-like n=1 Tax=Rhizophora mucronata TaxID=61149 RepID=A0A2P2KJ01_RHIMU
MELEPTPSGNRSLPKRNRRRAPTTIQSLDNDILCFIFSLVGLFGIVRCRVVCKSWHEIIAGSKLLEELCSKRRKDDKGTPKRRSVWPGRSLNNCLERLAMEEHGSALAEGSVEIHQWRIHANRVAQCRMKMGLLLTGVGDRVMRLWSLKDYKCVREYSLPALPLLDFDFDESKIVGLVGSHLCIWRHSGQRTIFPSHQSAFVMGSCMRYFDPEAVVGCEDGTARVYDMYSRKCSRIIRMHPEAVTCLSLDDDKLIFSGSTLGRITVSGLSFDERVVTLKDSDYAGQ